MHLGIGTPPQPVQLTLDTGSDLTWTQCRPCISCFHQALPYFDPSLSSTFQELSCGNETCLYTYSYGDNSTTNGQLDADTFTFVAVDGRTGTAVPGLSFGCGHNNSGIFTSNETGIAGFGRGSCPCRRSSRSTTSPIASPTSRDQRPAPSCWASRRTSIAA